MAFTGIVCRIRSTLHLAHVFAHSRGLEKLLVVAVAVAVAVAAVAAVAVAAVAVVRVLVILP